MTRKTNHKYFAEETCIDGIKFDSKAEARRYQELQLLSRAGEITNLELQPRFVLMDGFRDNKGKKHRPIEYVADFSYDEQGNPRRVIEDTKGFKTPEFKLKMKLFLKRYPEYDFRLSS